MPAFRVCLVRLQISNVLFVMCYSSVCRFIAKLYILYKILRMLHFLQNVQNREFCKLFAIRHFIINLSRSRRWFFCHCWVVPESLPGICLIVAPRPLRSYSYSIPGRARDMPYATPTCHIIWFVSYGLAIRQAEEQPLHEDSLSIWTIRCYITPRSAPYETASRSRDSSKMPCGQN